MKGMEWQVTSLELSRKIKELGFPQDSLWRWVIYKRVKFTRLKQHYFDSEFNEEKWYSAPTVAELLELMPKTIELENNPFSYGINITTFGKKWIITYESDALRIDSVPEDYHSEKDVNINNALAKMWIYLKENKLI